MKKDIRIGVFVCRCGSNIAGVVDIADLVEYSRKLEDVVLVDEGKWSCSADYLSKLELLIKEYNINRVVIASCSPRTHESLFKQALKKAGLNPYLLEFVSIREQVSWVHMDFPKVATQKAKDLVSMGVAKASKLEKGFEIKLPVINRSCLIIGGGASGINAALSIASQGFKAYIVEKEPFLGGFIRKSSFIATEKEKMSSERILSNMLQKVRNNKNITVLSNSKIESFSGYIGNYSVKIVNLDGNIVKINTDTVIVATGMYEFKPEGQFFYGKDKRIVTQSTFEQQIIDKEKLKSLNSVVIINCVNSKNDERGCCNIGCHVALKNAILLKKANINTSIYIMYRDLSIYRKSGSMLSEGKRLGINFIRFYDHMYPEVSLEDKAISVKVFDVLLGKDLVIMADQVVLTTAFVGNEKADEIKKFLKVSTDCDNFFQEAHVKLHPLEFPSDGIALCGCAKYPMFFEESCNEGIGAAMRISIPMNLGYTKADGIIANINLDECNKCGLCLKKCPYRAIILDNNDFPKLVEALCRGCGLCSADCPTKSISIVHYSDKQIFAQINAALEKQPGNKIIGFVCHWCALGGVDMAGVGRLQYHTSVRLIRVMCSARVSIGMIEEAFKLGAAGVIVAGCEFPTCHYISGNYAAKKRINIARKKIKKQGFDPEKLWVTWCSAADGPKFASTINNMAKKLNI